MGYRRLNVNYQRVKHGAMTEVCWVTREVFSPFNLRLYISFKYKAYMHTLPNQIVVHYYIRFMVYTYSSIISTNK